MVDWFIENGRKVLSWGAAAFLILFSIFLLTKRIKGPAEAAYMTASNEFASFQNGKEERLAPLEKNLKRHPELETKFGAYIAQHFLDKGDLTHAGDHLQKAVKRLEKTSPQHLPFVKVSLLISEGNLLEALKESVRLKVELKAQKKDYPFLYAYNLFRMASLAGALGLMKEEFAAWKEIKRNLAGANETAQEDEFFDRATFYLLANELRQDSLTLSDYIDYRLQLLSAQL